MAVKNTELLLDAIGDVQDEYIRETERFISRKRKARIAAISSIAAVLVIVTVITLIVRIIGQKISVPDEYDNPAAYWGGNTDYSAAEDDDPAEIWGGNANYSVTAETGGGYLYYEIPYDGIYRYQPGKTAVKLVDTEKREWCDYLVNDDALYFAHRNLTADRDKTVYRIPHGSDTPEVLYRDDDAKRVSMTATAGTHDLCLFIDTDEYAFKEIIIDGVTGKEKEIISSYSLTEDTEKWNELIDDDNYDVDELYDMTHTETSYHNPRITYTVGERTITALMDDEDSGYFGYSLTENGKILRAGCSVIPKKAMKNCLVFERGDIESAPDDLPQFGYYIIREDGTHNSVTLENVGDLQGNDTYWYYLDFDDNLIAFNTRTLEKSVLMHQEDLSYCQLASDGEYLYLYDYADEQYLKEAVTPISCYKIIYNADGVPTSLELIDDDIKD